MRNCFVDSWHYIAVLNPYDAYHKTALAVAEGLRDVRFWTTEAVLLEVANALSSVKCRRIAVKGLRLIFADPFTTVVPVTHDLFERGLILYERCLDKEWSLTDCISFVVMREHSIKIALTGDHHFEQAGFRKLY